MYKSFGSFLKIGYLTESKQNLFRIFHVVFLVSCVLVSEDQFSLRIDPDEDGVDMETDCDNSDPSIGAPYEYFFDGDNDGFGDMTSGIFYCTNPGGRWILDGTDCNDNNPQIHPNALEICDGIDNNCDKDIDYVSQDTTEVFEGIIYYEDLDGDGYGSSETIESCYPLEGYVLESGDCNDNDWAVSPIAIEQCGDDVDQNCNGYIDDEECYLSAFDAQAWLRSDLSNPLGVGGIISDINGNGTLDVITNAPVSGITPESSAAFQIFEGALGGEIYSGEADHRIYLSDEEFGGTVITSDMNGDGQDDLLFSLPRNSFNGVDSGAVFLMWGPIQQDRFLSFEADAMWYGYTDSLAGYSLANLGDVTGDGISDIVIGAYKETYNGPNSGAAYIIFGGQQ